MNAKLSDKQIEGWRNRFIREQSGWEKTQLNDLCDQALGQAADEPCRHTDVWVSHFKNGDG